MTAIIIIAAVAVLIFFLLASSVTIEMEYDSTFKYKVKYLFFTFIMNPESPRRIKRRKRKEKRKEKKKRKQESKKRKKNKGNVTAPSSADKTQTEEPAESGTEKTAQKAQTEKKAEKPTDKGAKAAEKFSFDLIRRIYNKSSPHIKRILKKIRFSRVLVDVTVGGEDAAKTAISYGVHCAAVYGLVSFLDSAVRFKAEKINIRADFDLKKSSYYARGTVKLRLSTLLHSGIWGFFAVLAEIRKDSDSAASSKSNKPQTKKAA